MTSCCCFCFSWDRGRSPFSLQLSTAPTNMSSKLYLNSNPKSLSFFEENDTFSNFASTPLNLPNSKKDRTRVIYRTHCNFLAVSVGFTMATYFVGMLYSGYLSFRSLAMPGMFSSWDEQMYRPLASGCSYRYMWDMQRSSRWMNWPCLMIE